MPSMEAPIIETGEPTREELCSIAKTSTQAKSAANTEPPMGKCCIVGEAGSSYAENFSDRSDPTVLESTIGIELSALQQWSDAGGTPGLAMLREINGVSACARSTRAEASFRCAVRPIIRLAST